VVSLARPVAPAQALVSRDRVLTNAGRDRVRNAGARTGGVAGASIDAAVVQERAPQAAARSRCRAAVERLGG